MNFHGSHKKSLFQRVVRHSAKIRYYFITQWPKLSVVCFEAELCGSNKPAFKKKTKFISKPARRKNVNKHSVAEEI